MDNSGAVDTTPLSQNTDPPFEDILDDGFENLFDDPFGHTLVYP